MKAFLQKHVFGLVCLLLLSVAGVAVLMAVYGEKMQLAEQEHAQLMTQLRAANEAQKEAVITRRVSSQMEEIAYQQKEISDQQKQEAEHQTRIAEQLRDHAELEREKAFNAQQAAIEAYEQMEQQKRIAEQRREEAELAQMRADSLARLALGRSLGVQATKQYEVGNRSLATLLSYAAWKFTADNQGDVYQPAIYKALSLSSGLSQQWRIHKGAIRRLMTYRLEGTDYLISASQYGEIFRWTLSEDQLGDQLTLFSDPQCDFRQICIDRQQGRLLALSFSGQLVVIGRGQQVSSYVLPIQQPVGMEWLDQQLAIVQKTGEITLVTLDSWQTHTLYHHPQMITALSTSGEDLLIGDAQGGVYRVNRQGEARQVWQTIKQPVTALCQPTHSDRLAIGYKHGLVLAVDLALQQSQEWTEHVSPITCIVFDGTHCFTSSMDGRICLWQWQLAQKGTASLVYEGNAWLHTFVLGMEGKNLLIGNEQGYLCKVAIDPQQMADEVYRRLERNFTPEEWNDYIGEVSAYETYK